MTTQTQWSQASGKTACDVNFGKSTMAVDIDESAGGSDDLPHPHDLLDAALASCTTLTLQLYAKHKKFDVQRIQVEVSHHRGDAGFVMARSIQVTGTLSEEQKASILRIANACPVHKTLIGEIAIETNVETTAS